MRGEGTKAFHSKEKAYLYKDVSKSKIPLGTMSLTVLGTIQINMEKNEI